MELNIEKIISRIPSIESRQKNRLSHLGKKHSLETRAKLSIISSGRIHSKETRVKISDTKKGVKFSDQHKKNISEAKKGSIPWNKGKKGVQVSTKKGIKLSEEARKKLSTSHLGIKPSLESNRKRSLAMKEKGVRPPVMFGEKNPSWKGGVTPETKKIRNSVEMDIWRKSCLERDDFTCQKTGQIGGKLAVHHINNFSDFPELRMDINNGITLSYISHNKFHKKYGKKNNTREQLNEFLK